jgi:hypothetical protein
MTKQESSFAESAESDDAQSDQDKGCVVECRGTSGAGKHNPNVRHSLQSMPAIGTTVSRAAVADVMSSDGGLIQALTMHATPPYFSAKPAKFKFVCRSVC